MFVTLKLLRTAQAGDRAVFTAAVIARASAGFAARRCSVAPVPVEAMPRQAAAAGRRERLRPSVGHRSSWVATTVR